MNHCTEEATHEKDLLQMILDGAETYDDYNGLSKERFIVDNCKNVILLVMKPLLLHFHGP